MTPEREAEIRSKKSKDVIELVELVDELRDFCKVQVELIDNLKGLVDKQQLQIQTLVPPNKRIEF